jgi:hypothetical protein
MALRTLGAFVAGVGVGWVARSTVGSTREALVQAIVAAHRLREGARRLVAEHVEWAEDMFAEGRARYEMLRDHVPMDDEVPPQVVAVGSNGAGGTSDSSQPSNKRGQAA